MIVLRGSIPIAAVLFRNVGTRNTEELIVAAWLMDSDCNRAT
jgi:hypothetical protein